MTLCGSQTPRVAVRPSGAVRSWGPDASRLAAASGLVLDPWQSDLLDCGLGVGADGLWTAADVVGIVSRQNGKNGAVEAAELLCAGILGLWVIHTAHQFKTTKESQKRLLELARANPETADLVVHTVASPASGYEIHFRSGGKVVFIARSKTSGRGLTGDMLVIDEAQDCDDDALGALIPVLSARPNPQTWWLGSAPGPDSIVWHRMRAAGRAGSVVRQVFFEFSADPSLSLDDRSAWCQANPALGTRITEAAVVSERQKMSDELFARERLGISPDLPTDAGDELLSRWTPLTDAYSEPVGDVCIGVDVAINGASAAISVAGFRFDGIPTVEVARSSPGTSWVVPELVHMLRTFAGSRLVVDPGGPAGELVPLLEAERAKFVKASTRDVTAAAGGFLSAVREGRLRHRGQFELNAAVAGARRRDVGEAWAWGRKGSGADISPLVAATLALWGLKGRPVTTGDPGFYDLADFLVDDDD